MFIRYKKDILKIYIEIFGEECRILLNKKLINEEKFKIKTLIFKLQII